MSASMLGQERHYQQTQALHSSTQRHAPPPPISRQISNTSSNMTSGTTASGSLSENWETYSDASDLEPERDARDAYHAKVHAAAGKRVAGSHAYGQMKAPPLKTRHHDRIDEGNENARVGLGITQTRVEGSDAAWSTEMEETY